MDKREGADSEKSTNSSRKSGKSKQNKQLNHQQRKNSNNNNAYGNCPAIQNNKIFRDKGTSKRINNGNGPANRNDNNDVQDNNSPIKRNDTNDVQGKNSPVKRNGNNQVQSIGSTKGNNSLQFHRMNQGEFLKLIEQQCIEELDEPIEIRKFQFAFYCKNCECLLRNEGHIRDHMNTVEHMAQTNRYNDRSFLRKHFTELKAKYGSPSREHINSLGLLSASIQNNSDFMQDEFIQQKDIHQILAALETILQDEFGPEVGEGEKVVKLQITGSFFTGLHVTKENTCDLNIFAKFHKSLLERKKISYLFNGSFEAIKMICRHLPKSSPLSPGRMLVHYGAPTIRIQLFFDQFSYFVTLGMGEQAEKAHCSTRCVQAYLLIWPPLKRLIRFVRCWAQINHLTFQACAGITNFAFDILCIFYLQRIGYLPVLNEFIDECMAEEEDHQPKHNIPVQNIDQLCRLPEEEFSEACRQLRNLYYGKRVPLLNDGELIHGFFKYFSTEFDLRTKCDIKSFEVVDKPNGEKHFMVIDPFLDCNIMKLRLEGNAYLWNCIIKTATYLCIPQTPEGPVYIINFDKMEFEMKKSKISFIRIRNADLKWNKRVQSLIRHGNCPLEYNFDALNFLQPGEIPMIVCQHCHLQGHCDWDCYRVRPSSSIGLIPPIRANLRNDLTNAIQNLYKDSALGKKRSKKITQYIHELGGILSETLAVDDLTLTPFGSVVNGFGTNDCDLDLCLQSAQITQIQTQKVIEKIDKKLHEMGYTTQPVFTAKVPIVKFQDPDKNFRGDISIGNCLGLKNSNLLKAYTEFDARVAPLGLFIKRLFKSANLNDSPTGSFSSYSIIVLLIYYLQRGCEPPILPFLQELANDVDSREMLEGWDVTFAKEYCKEESGKLNEQSLAELFVGFLHYFSGKFDPKMDVVQIRHSATLLKMDKTNGTKRWDQYTFCVEDPFDLNHNLCGGIKQDVLHQFFMLMRNALRELSLIDTKREKSDQWGLDSRQNDQGGRGISPLSALLRDHGTGINKLLIMPKVLGFL